ncbi:hypothetical protein DYI23_11690 [Roseibium polysiphoniae]|uniref:Uncharacterized protein n=1 Tax=Roseibium polysiphoniae TaxID=2571221 RepID=A0A944CEC6_9HYPH|nr:hypothetical protein [Roseibium polysiphoniae]
MSHRDATCLILVTKPIASAAITFSVTTSNREVVTERFSRHLKAHRSAPIYFGETAISKW